MEEVRRETSPYFPKTFLENKYNTDAISFVVIQIDKILAFKELPE